MKKLILIALTLLMMSCSSDSSESTSVNQINVPEFARGTWHGIETNTVLKVSEHRISFNGTNVTQGTEVFTSISSYRILEPNFEVLILKSGDRIFFRYVKDGVTIIFECFER